MREWGLENLYETCWTSEGRKTKLNCLLLRSVLFASWGEEEKFLWLLLRLYPHSFDWVYGSVDRWATQRAQSFCARNHSRVQAHKNSFMIFGWTKEDLSFHGRKRSFIAAAYSLGIDCSNIKNKWDIHPSYCEKASDDCLWRTTAWGLEFFNQTHINNAKAKTQQKATAPDVLSETCVR